MRRHHLAAAESGETAGTDDKRPRSVGLRSARTIILVLALGVLLLMARESARRALQPSAATPPTSAERGPTVQHIQLSSMPSPSRSTRPTALDGHVGGETTTPANTLDAAMTRPPARIGLLMLVVGSHFPVWWPFLTMSYARNHPTYQLIVVHTGEPPATAAGHEHVRYVQISLPTLADRFVRKLGVSSRRVDDKFASAKGLSDLKPFYGHIFEDLIDERAYTHWGWVDWDLLIGDLPAVISEASLWEYDVLTFPGATLGFALAGQLSILRNDDASRRLYRVVDSHVDLGFKVGSGEARQSGWEERVLLREALRRRPKMSVFFHMAAQFDYKAQWLTWVPFDHYWHEGKVWRCARQPLHRPDRPPLLVQNMTRWLADVQQIQSDPWGFQARKDGRVCIRWDLESSPWRCCPHATGVHYLWRNGRLLPALHPHANASAHLRHRLSSAAREAHAKPREPSYDVCQEGAFFHAGLTPRGDRTAPKCTSGTWALQDDIGRFSGTLQLLSENCPDPSSAK